MPCAQGSSQPRTHRVRTDGCQINAYDPPQNVLGILVVKEVYFA